MPVDYYFSARHIRACTRANVPDYRPFFLGVERPQTSDWLVGCQPNLVIWIDLVYAVGNEETGRVFVPIRYGVKKLLYLLCCIIPMIRPEIAVLPALCLRLQGSR